MTIKSLHQKLFPARNQFDPGGSRSWWTSPCLPKETVDWEMILKNTTDLADLIVEVISYTSCVKSRSWWTSPCLSEETVDW